MRDFFIGIIGTMVIFLILGIGGMVEMYFQKNVLTFPKLYDIIKKKRKRGNAMAVSRKIERELLRNEYLKDLISHYEEKGEEVLRAKSNEIAIPVVGCEGNEDFIVITVKVPTGANKGLEPYDGYAMAEEYEMKLKEKEAKAKANAEKKAKKIAKDAEIRKKKSEKVK